VDVEPVKTIDDVTAYDEVIAFEEDTAKDEVPKNPTVLTPNEDEIDPDIN
jgi:hypothetical protein